MFEFLKSTPWSFARVKPAKKPEPWSLDRNWHRTEAERNLKLRNFTEALHHMAFVVEDADRRRASAKQRIRLRLEIADLRRRTAVPTSAEARETEVCDANSTQLAAAEVMIRAALEIAAAYSDHEEYVNCLDALADVFTDSRRFPELEKLEEEALRLGAGLTHPDPIRMAKRVHRLGVARHKMGHIEDAIPALEKSIRLHEETYGKSSREIAILLYEIGSMYRAQGDYPRAQECLSRALRIHENEVGPDSPEAVADLQQLAGSFEDAGDLDSAAAQYERCLMMKLRKLGLNDLEEVASMQYSLANLHVGWGNLARARELMSECIGIFRRDGGPRLAVSHEILAQIEERSGRYHGAVKELELAGKVWEKCTPSRRTELIRNLDYRADLLIQLRKTKEASWLRERVQALESDGTVKAQSA
ncbi:MAG: tetratricopeptide repeat protein [Acidobacteriota bacterium]